MVHLKPARLQTCRGLHSNHQRKKARAAGNVSGLDPLRQTPHHQKRKDHVTMKDDRPIKFRIEGDDPLTESINVALEHIYLSDIHGAWERAWITAQTFTEPLEFDGQKLNFLPIGQAVMYGAVMYILGNRGI